jgi:hypothetical protein
MLSPFSYQRAGAAAKEAASSISYLADVITTGISRCLVCYDVSFEALV